MKKRNQEGQAMAEFAIAFPVFIVFIMGITQIALILYAYSIVNYAAFCCCRTGTLTNANDQQIKLTASKICAPLAGSQAQAYFRISIVKELLQTEATVKADVLRVKVIYRYKLICPFLGRIFSRGQIFYFVNENSIPISSTCVMRMVR